jgi:hypothetical protein
LQVRQCYLPAKRPGDTSSSSASDHHDECECTECSAKKEEKFGSGPHLVMPKAGGNKVTCQGCKIAFFVPTVVVACDILQLARQVGIRASVGVLMAWGFVCERERRIEERETFLCPENVYIHGGFMIGDVAYPFSLSLYWPLVARHIHPSHRIYRRTSPLHFDDYSLDSNSIKTCSSCSPCSSSSSIFALICINASLKDCRQPAPYMSSLALILGSRAAILRSLVTPIYLAPPKSSGKRLLSSVPKLCTKLSQCPCLMVLVIITIAVIPRGELGINPIECLNISS